MAKQACLVCGRRPADAHHLRFAQHRALGRKVSDEFIVPLCRGHHRDEAAWWKNAALTRPQLPARCGWRPIPLPTIPDEMHIDRPSSQARVGTDRTKFVPIHDHYVYHVRSATSLAVLSAAFLSSKTKIRHNEIVTDRLRSRDRPTKCLPVWAAKIAKTSNARFEARRAPWRSAEGYAKQEDGVCACGDGRACSRKCIAARSDSRRNARTTCGAGPAREDGAQGAAACACQSQGWSAG